MKRKQGWEGKLSSEDSLGSIEEEASIEVLSGVAIILKETMEEDGKTLLKAVSVEPE